MGRLIIDVREPAEFAAGHVAGALNLPPARLMGDLAELDGVPKDTEIIVYCRTGSRSNVAMHILQAKGFSNVLNGINQGHVRSRYGG